MKIIKTIDPNIPAEVIANKINSLLKENKQVLWFVAGGSSMSVAVLASKLINQEGNLAILLTDERYGMPGDKDSNEQQLKDLGFRFPISSVLTGKAKEETIEEFARSVEKNLSGSDVIVGLFGMGADGHVAGIMPKSIAANPDADYAVGYQGSQFYRITITEKVFAKINFAYLWVQDDAKKEALEKLLTEYPKALQPAQYLKDCGELEIYTGIEI